MSIAKVITTGRSQTVRLPKDCRLKVKEVKVKKIGDVIVLLPPKKGWALLEEVAGTFPEDFLADRKQPVQPDRREPL
jgi:antitoxin VapB